MRAWYIPAWNGDWRLEPGPSDKATKLTIEKPTAMEKRVLAKLADRFIEKKWITDLDAVRMRDPSGWRKTNVTIAAPLTKVGPYAASLIKPGQNVITAVRFKDGKIEVSETSTVEEDEKPAHPYRDTEPKTTDAPPAVPKPKEADTPTKESVALAKKEGAEAAATVKRPTPCCPSCFVTETNKPATEVLLSFLNEEEHAMWAKHRYIIVHGGITGHRYRIAHRHTEIAQQQTRIAWDLDDDALIHCHDWTTPPEEEVLATMLILKFREPWLRNEATALGCGFTNVFKNPFGDGGDGVMDSMWTNDVGHKLMKFLQS